MPSASIVSPTANGSVAGALATQTHSYTAVFPYALAIIFLALISFPGLIDLPGRVSAATAFMMFSIPFWFHAATTRSQTVFDPAAVTGILIVLPCVFFLIVWSFLSAMTADLPFRSGRSIASLLTAFAACFLVMGTITSVRLHTYLKVMSFALAITCVATIVALQEPNLSSMIFRGSDRARGFFKNPNQFGMAVTTLAPVVLGYALTSRGRRTAWAGCYFLLMAGLILSGSKMNILLTATTTGAMIALLAYALNSGSRRVAMLSLGILCYVLLIFFGTFMLSVFNPRALLILNNLFASSEVQSLQARAALWELSIQQFVANPIFGQGAGQPLSFFEGGRQITHSHNIFLDIIRTQGLPGLAGFLVFATATIVLSLGAVRLAVFAKSANKQARVETLGLAIGSMAYLLANISSDSMGPSTSPFFWLAFFLCMASRRRLT